MRFTWGTTSLLQTDPGATVGKKNSGKASNHQKKKKPETYTSDRRAVYPARKEASRHTTWTKKQTRQCRHQVESQAAPKRGDTVTGSATGRRTPRKRKRKWTKGREKKLRTSGNHVVWVLRGELQAQSKKMFLERYDDARPNVEGATFLAHEPRETKPKKKAYLDFAGGNIIEGPWGAPQIEKQPSRGGGGGRAQHSAGQTKSGKREKNMTGPISVNTLIARKRRGTIGKR